MDGTARRSGHHETGRPVADSVFSPIFRNSDGMMFWGADKAAVKETARDFRERSLDEVLRLLGSEVHEVRSLALWILRFAYGKAPEGEKDPIVAFYREPRTGGRMGPRR